MTTLRLKCTVCGRALRSLDVSDVAIEVRSVTCPGCRAPHTIKVDPKKLGALQTHVVTFAATRSPL